MYCHNCGRNCGNDRFCADCGTQLRQETAVPAPSAHPQPEHVEPAQQSTPPQPSGNTFKGSPDFPANTTYHGNLSTYLDLKPSSVMVSPPLGYEHRVEIPYAELAAVVYRRPASGGWLKKSGVMLFRGTAHQNIPIPDVHQMSSDNIAVIVPNEKALLFYYVFYALKAVAPASADFQLLIPESKIQGLDQLAKGIDFDDLWNRYSPNRLRAIKAIQEKYQFPQKVSAALVDREFDARQKNLYAADPLYAIKDMNYLENEKRKEAQNYKRLREELRDVRIQRQLEELSSDVDYIATRMRLDRMDDE